MSGLVTHTTLVGLAIFSVLLTIGTIGFSARLHRLLQRYGKNPILQYRVTAIIAVMPAFMVTSVTLLATDHVETIKDIDKRKALITISTQELDNNIRRLSEVNLIEFYDHAHRAKIGSLGFYFLSSVGISEAFQSGYFLTCGSKLLQLKQLIINYQALSASLLQLQPEYVNDNGNGEAGHFDIPSEWYKTLLTNAQACEGHIKRLSQELSSHLSNDTCETATSDDNDCYERRP